MASNTEPSSSKLLSVLDIVISLAIHSLVGPLFLALAALRFLVLVAAKVKYGSDAELVDAPDAFGFIESMASNIYFILEVNGRVEVEQLQERVRKNLTDMRVPNNGQWRHKKLRSYVEVFLGYGVYRFEEPFEIRRHVLPVVDQLTGQTRVFTSKGDAMKTIEAMREGKYMPMEPKVSPWKIHLMYYTNPSSDHLSNAVTSVIVVEVPHAVSDGYSTANVFTDAILDRSPLDRTERKLCSSAGPKTTLWQGLVLRASGILGMFCLLGQREVLNLKQTNPFDEVRKSRRTQVQDWGKSPHKSRTVYLPPPVYLNTDIFADFRNATGINTFPVIISAYLRAMTRYWYKHKLSQRASNIESCKDWIFTIGIPVSLWDPQAPLQLANNVSVGRPAYKASEFMDENIVKVLKYVKKKMADEIEKTTWVGWGFTKLFLRNLPKPMLEMYGALTENIPMTVTMPALRLTFKPNLTVFGHELMLACFHPAVLPPQDIGAIINYHNGTVLLQLFASSMVVDSEKEVREMLNMVEEEVFLMHEQLLTSSGNTGPSKLGKFMIPSNAFFMGTEQQIGDQLVPDEKLV